MTNDYDADSKRTRLAATKRNCMSGNLSLIDSYGARACDFRNEIFPRELLLKERQCTTTGQTPSCPPRRRVPRKSSHPISLPDCEWWMLTLHIFPLHRGPPSIDSHTRLQYPVCTLRRGISIPPEWLRHLLSAVHIRILILYCLKSL